MSSVPPSVPQGVPELHVVTEGRSLRAAVEAAAAQLGVPYALVEHKIDLAHFRSAQGAGVGADTVRIFAWSKNPVDYAPVLAAEEWMKGLLAAMERTATVRAELRGGTVNIYVDAGEAGRHLVGRGGTTLKALQYLLEESVGPRFPGAQFRIDVARPPEDREEGGERRDDRGRDDRGRDDRGERRDDRGGERRDAGRGGERREARGDRPPGGGDRGRDRGDRGERRGPRRDDDRPRRSEADEEELKRLARKIAERVRETGEAEVIRRELNSYDRRIVHVEIAAIEGVGSRSVGEGHDRRIEIHAADGSSGGEGAE